MTPASAAELKARIMASARSTPAPLRTTVRLTRFVIALVAGTGLVIAFASLGGIHWDGRPRTFILGAGAGFLAVAVAVTVIVLRRPSMLSGGSRRMWWLYALLPFGLLAWSVAWNLLFPQTFTPCRGRIGLVCRHAPWRSGPPCSARNRNGRGDRRVDGGDPAPGV
jgi:hypothetical protein